MPIGSSVYPPITISEANSIKITPLSISLSGTEYAHVLQSNLTQIRIKCRGSASLKISFNLGESGTDYWTIPRGCTDSIDGVNFSGKTLYLQVDKPNMIIEVMEFYLI